MTQRVVSFILAALIFGSAVLSGVFVFQAIKKEQDLSKINPADAAANSQQEQQATAEQQAAAETQAQAQQQTETPKENALKDKPLTNFTPITDRITTLGIEDVMVGEGAEAAASSTVTVHYTGATMKDGIVFESSKDGGAPATFPLGNLIQGWKEGIPGMKVGGVRRLTIPAEKAYGETGRVSGDLVFDIELLGVK
jgi:peptidylprolyl isomerase